MKNNINFILKVTGFHLLTYMLCGIVFAELFDYQTLFTTGNTEYFMKPVEGAAVKIGPFIQVIRGVLFGAVLLLFKDAFVEKRLGWLKLWLIILILGIINTPGPAPFSIEGVVYTKLPLEFHLKGAIEIMVQTLLFSYLVAKPKGNKKINNRFEKNKKPIIAALFSGIIFSLSGIVLSFILNVDIMAGTQDLGAFVIMFIAIITVFIVNKWFYQTKNKFKWMIVIFVYYLTMAVLPTTYNYLFDSPFKSFLTLGINIVSVLLLVGYNLYTNKSDKI